MGGYRQVDDGEDPLFLAEVADGRPLGDRARVKAPVQGGRTRPPSTAPGLLIERDPEAPTGRAATVSEAELARLAAGRVRPEATIDLHGLSEDEAAGALERFFAAARAERRRCVLVVTGKGLHSPAGAVLRHAVPELLAGRLAGHVRAFAPARPSDGGAGALYVLLATGARAHRSGSRR